MFGLKVPVIAVVIGEGGSGGALGIAIANKALMMEYSVYSVISPESCASILWSDPKKAEMAANSLKLGPNKALELKIIDSIVKEPVGGAHRDLELACSNLKSALTNELKDLEKMSAEELIEDRFNKFRNMGNQTIITSDKGQS